MHTEWLAVEHHRLHLIEEWPAGPRRDAALEAVRSAIASLLRDVPTDGPAMTCIVCASRVSRVAPIDVAGAQRAPALVREMAA